MPQYVVTTPDGKRFGPTDFQTLVQWAVDGRVLPGMIVEDLLSGQTMTASAVPGLFDGVADTVEAGPSPPLKRNPANRALTFGIVGLIAWCFPIAGFAVGVAAIAMGWRTLGTEDRLKGIIAIALGVICVLLSAANAILGAIMLNQLKN